MESTFFFVLQGREESRLIGDVPVDHHHRPQAQHRTRVTLGDRLASEGPNQLAHMFIDYC